MTAPRKEQLSDDIVCWLGDCREVLPMIGRVDAVVTDPPYGIGRDGSRRSTGSHGGRKAHEFRGWDSDRPSRSTFAAVLASANKHVIWGGNYFADILPPTPKWLVWDKGQRIAQSDGELAWTSEATALRIFELNRVALLLEGACHPTQKPVEIMSWSILQISPAMSILDPFMGSGSTGVAAVNLARNFTGIEIDETYFDIACRRISEALKRPRLPLPESVKVKQEALW